MCYKTKIYNKQVLETMMAANEFEPGSKAPKQPNPDDHPFLRKANEGEVGLNISHVQHILSRIISATCEVNSFLVYFLTAGD
jgi:hypothetical protein